MWRSCSKHAGAALPNPNTERLRWCRDSALTIKRCRNYLYLTTCVNSEQKIVCLSFETIKWLSCLRSCLVLNENPCGNARKYLCAFLVQKQKLTCGDHIPSALGDDLPKTNKRLSKLPSLKYKLWAKMFCLAVASSKSPRPE